MKAWAVVNRKGEIVIGDSKKEEPDPDGHFLIYRTERLARECRMDHEAVKRVKINILKRK